MRVQQSSTSFSSAHSLTRTYKNTEDLEVWDNRAGLSASLDETVISGKGREILSASSGNDEASLEASIEPKYLLLARLIASLTGHAITLLIPGRTKASAGSEGWGIRYSSATTYTETEQTVFDAKGVVTANGKEYAFSTSLSMDRSFSVSTSTSILAGDALKDPLVVNLGQGYVDLSGSRIKFDINMDGKAEDMPTLGNGSGYLTIDRNGNGIVDNGSELFGPATGDGFGELAAYDEDKNGWIDEADSVYSRLGVFTQDNGAGTVQSLKDLNIGALCTESASTPFEMKDGLNGTLAKVQETGVYLREDGTVGTTQKIDVAL